MSSEHGYDDMVKGQLSAAHPPLQRYRLYARGYGFAVVALLILAAGVPGAGAAAAGSAGALALLSAVYLGRLWVWGAPLREKDIRLPHGVTAIRGAAASAVFASVAVLHVYGAAFSDGERWVLLGVFTLVESTDLIDGILARRLRGRLLEGGAGEGRAKEAEGGPGESSGAEAGPGRPESGGPPGLGGGSPSFGAIWDMECDAAYVLALSTASWLWAGMPAAVLCIGGMRYAYASVLDRPLGLANPPRLYMRFAKSVAAAAALALLISFVPGLPPPFRAALPWIVLPALVVSFAWDSLLRFRRRRSI